MDQNEAVAEAFGVRDADSVSKRALISYLARTLEENAILKIELFCADPYHNFFKGQPEETLSAFRLERISRKSCKKQ